jgi:UDP-N-acetylmuramoylalanine--D-glutamate ligase
LGWGMDTQDVEPWLREQGAKITILDEKKDGKPFGNLNGYDVLVRSPGVYRYRNEIADAEKKGIEITSKTKIFFDEFPGKIIGVTGTKGKGTTATLIYEIMKAAGMDVFLAGNIGEGMFGKNADWAVLELSSFQLIDLEKSPTIAVVLMVTSDHLDWHKNEEEYVRAKANIVKFQKNEDWAVVNKDYPNSVKIGEMAGGTVMWVSKNDLQGIERDAVRLRGEHNLENIAASNAVARILGINESIKSEVIKNFKGLEHRLEEVVTVNGVTYFDDSFSTTPETTMAAIKAFTEPIILIAGGSEKGSDYSLLGKTISEAKNIKAVILIGKMADRIGEAISKSKGKSKIIQGCRNMSEIVLAASNTASPGDVVLLSPACASFDMFENYKDRGQQFKSEVLRLKGS